MTTMRIARHLYMGALAAVAFAAGSPHAGEKAPDQPAVKEETDPQKLLAMREKSQGPRFPGKDPAFLVLPRPSERPRLAKELLTEDNIAVAGRMLEYLAATQDPDGGWTDQQYASNSGVAALAVLALMSEGSRPRIGKYGKQIDRGMEFLMKKFQSGSGVFAGNNPFGPMYEHAYSTLAMLIAYGDLPWQGRKPREMISRALQAILNAQRIDGGWRYELSRLGHSDLSVTAVVLWVLRTAKKCGYTVPAEAITKGVKFVETCAEPDGIFRYRYLGSHASPSLGGIGIVALSNGGMIDHALIPAARDRIKDDFDTYTVNDLKERRYFGYGAFSASLAMYTCGDRYFIPWFKKATLTLKAMQRKDGEVFDQHGNTVYPTAMAAMVLLSPKGYLPIYER